MHVFCILFQNKTSAWRVLARRSFFLLFFVVLGIAWPSIRCSLRSPITVFHVRCHPRKCVVFTYFLVAFWNHLGTFFIVFGVPFQSLIFSAKWEGRRGLGWAGLAPENKDTRVWGQECWFLAGLINLPAVPEHNLCIRAERPGHCR